ncbi:acetyl-CoA carboxylase biotin carboxylase subunit [Truepera radiovictrix]|uniref:Biotin carboxylase n=1 Tax=Truepera radiovictrix (strain DSM 17093 / CIP 108686 / LMG 22925 / RQ-24) TaxID=649638 RepID=D7CVY0_TRURR|nr:acetyl-CoA carboxylase biotin carboxylase subunit [Truepera radiovictrix]ADI14243.1 acetyl-CoA carboxylase, biotin carboxylase [Truepera radiovictrix DSM 17093]WMT57200.1 acetyl-CoA carboxylase biotin carboxylase subunit [Truepera radiovictrix]
MFKKILIANRGEIALRVLRAARELGIKTVQVYSTADENSLPVLLADESICIGPPASAGSYLNVRNLLSAALVTGAEAIHPGYGFLSENAEFAQKCEEHGITFIGPRPENIRAIGDKASARRVAQESDVPVVPGSGALASLDEAKAFAAKIGYPVILKASAGGGGRGMRIVRSEEELARNLANAQEEARAAFGNGEMYMEKFLEEPRHVEIQVFGDGEGHVMHFFDRDCSIQRRYQKVLEEAPSTLDTALRLEIAEAAVRLARHINYRGAGTCEFLVDRDGSFYFSEMNTRIQVEHPVTEMVTRFDLVREQFRVAAGEGLSLAQEDVTVSGHAIEVRVNAEDPDRDFRPSAGTLTDVHWPGGPGIRVDSHVYAGYRIPPHYDSLVAKIIAWAPTRDEAIARMRRALQETVLEGIKTTIPFHLRVLDNAFYQRGAVYTTFIAKRMQG